MAKSFFIKTMGCQMNVYDSDAMARCLIDRGYSRTDRPENADVILVNTCTVRKKPEQKALSFLGRMLSIKKRKPALILGLTGCLAQQEGRALKQRFPELDLVVGPRETGRIGELIDLIGENPGCILATRMDVPVRRPVDCSGYSGGRVAEFVSIMEGCNNFCSYCIVPYVRGRERSRPPEDILLEARRLVNEGVREITLLGQNVNSYAREEGQWNFPRLLREMGRMEDLKRLRFTTSHPKDLSDELIGCFGEVESLCPHIHLPFQAGADPVLERMGRGYTRRRYLERVERLRNVRSDIAITSDVMVGFPGETDRDFQMTLDLVRCVRFDGLFSFKYSDRRGTRAAKMDRKVGPEKKSERLAMLQTVQKTITLEKNRGLEGARVEVLVEGRSKKGARLRGRTGTNKVVNFNCDSREIGNIINVTIERAFPNSLQGRVDGPWNPGEARAFHVCRN